MELAGVACYRTGDPRAALRASEKARIRIGEAAVQDERQLLVADHPGRPLLVFDGDCAFCRQWVARWRSITGERVEYRPAQEVAAQFPEIGEERFRARVWLIEPDGRAAAGARAVFRLYARAGEKRWLDWSYENIPAFAAL